MVFVCVGTITNSFLRRWNDWGAYINNLTDVENVRDISAGMASL